MKEKTEMLKWIRCWERAGAALEQIRRDYLDYVDLHLAIEALNDAFEPAILQIPPRKISDLVEIQA